MNIPQKLSALRRRTKALLLAAMLFLIWNILPEEDNRKSLRPPNTMTATLKPCTALRPEPGPYQEAEIEHPGTYCVSADFWQERLSDFAGHSGPAPYRHLVDVRASDVVIDISNHTLHSDGHSSGIVLDLDYKNIRSPDPATIRLLRMASNITIKNGVLDLRGMGTAVAHFNEWRMYTIDEKIPQNLSRYEKTNIVLENLLIKTDSIGIVLEGDSNIIRNCIIESGGTAAITMAGPNGQITNNTIILTKPFIPGNMQGTKFNENRHFFELLEERSRAKAAIALHQATGAVISGNRIEVKGKSPTRHNIYLTDASENVRIEGNTIVGAGDPVTLVKGSTATMKNNVFEQRKPWWKF